MAGIFGMVVPGEVSERSLQPMLDALKHRGPDEVGLRLGDGVGIGCCRLSVMDVDNGRQPVGNEDNTVWAVCDGEIYNHETLRRTLEEQGHEFRTRSDAEVIVHLYEAVGDDFVGQLRGMFAFALWDVKRKRLLAARDHLGQKPFFYSQDGRSLRFASEVKALVATGAPVREIDYEALHHYLSFRFIPAPLTMLRRVKKLPPASMLIWEGENVSVHSYWDLSFRRKNSLSDGEHISMVRDTLKNVVESHLMGDVPVGAFLSGGLDSGLIVAMMAKASSSAVSTFTVGVENKEFSEIPHARELSRRFGTTQHETIGQPELIALLPRIIRHLDEPSDPVAASKFIASRLAAQHVKAVLGGDGGDELFAGFDRYYGVKLSKYYSMVPSLLRERIIGPLVARTPSSFGYESIALQFRWMQLLAGLGNDGQRFAEAVSFFRFNHEAKQELLGHAAWKSVGDVKSSSLLEDQYSRSDAQDSVEKMLYVDYKMRLPEHSLMLTDRMGMAHSLEVRSPLVDLGLVELLAAIPARLKIRGRQRKYIERQIAELELPPGFARRKKRGFRFPLAAWFGRDLHPFLQRFFDRSGLVEEGIFRRAAILRLLSEHRDRRVDHHVRIWMLLNLEVWYALTIRGDSEAAVAECIDSYL